MKKFKAVLLLIIFSFTAVFTGCNKNETESDESLNLLKKKISNLTFSMACYSVTGYADENIPQLEKFYYPQNLHKLVSHRLISNYTIENYLPEYIGIMDCSGFYNPSFDDAAWVDDLLIRVEEERIAEELNQLDENQTDPLFVDENKAEEIEKVFSGEIEVTEYVGKSEKLSFVEFDSEIFIPQKTEDGYIIIHSIGDEVLRNIYNESFKLIKKETWSIKSVTNAVLSQTEEYFYDEETSVLKQKKVISDNAEIIILYDENGLVSEKMTYTVYNEKSYPVEWMAYIYDDEKRIIQEEWENYKYNQKYTKITEKFSKKHLYEYNEQEDIPADFEYFENDVLKMKNKYSADKGTYTSQIFFEGQFAVKTYYENYVRIKDVYTQDGKVVRVKEYEK